MKIRESVGLLCILGIIFCGSAYEVYSQDTHEQQDQIACLTIHSNDALLAIKHDLLARPHTEMFNQNAISKNEFLFHIANVRRENTRLVVPFTLISLTERADFQAVIKCSDLHNIEYDKL